MNNQEMQIKPIANPFLFTQNEIRTASDELGNTWFCAKDVCDALDVSWSNQTLKNMPKEWTCMIKVSMQSGAKETTFLSEPALYRLIFRSNKAKAIEFANWVCEEVLPSIRKWGAYGQVSSSQRISYSKQLVAVSEKLSGTTNPFLKSVLQQEVRDLSNILGHRVDFAELPAA